MEEAQREQQSPPFHYFRALAEELRIRYRIVHVTSQQIVLQSFRRFVRHLNTVLQYGHWESFRRIAGQPYTEITMRVLGHDDLVANPIELLHPRHGEVAVLQDDPLAAFDTALDHAGRDWALTLTQRDRHEVLLRDPTILGKLD